jgi:hypothetical protein
MPFRFGPWELLVLLIVLSIYFVPTIVALVRKVKNAAAIIILNVFLGWTFLGWVGSLVWALTAQKNTSPDNSTG